MPYPYKNYIPTSYQEAMTGNIGYDSQDLIDHDATPWASESRAHMDQLNAEIADLEKKVAEQRASRSRQLSDMKADPRWNIASLQFILNGDRSGMDAIASSIQAREQMQNSEALQRAIKAQEEAARFDDNMLNWQKAENVLSAAKQKFKSFKGREFEEGYRDAQLELANAEAQAAHWRKKVGKTEQDLAKDEVATVDTKADGEFKAKEDELVKTAEGKIANADTDAGVAAAQDAINLVQNPETRKQLNDKLTPKVGKTKEAQKKVHDEKLATANKAYASMNIAERRSYLKAHPEFVSVAGKLKYKGE